MDVVWLPYGDEPARGMWDQHAVEEAIARGLVDVKHRDDLPDGDCLIVVNGHGWAGHETQLASIADGRRVVVTSDEEGLLDWHRMPDGTLVQYWAGLGNGPTPWVRSEASKIACAGRIVDVSFAGQNTHRVRNECVDAVRQVGGVVRASDGFTKGLSHGDYTLLLAISRVVACPSGPLLPDTFRLYEAIEAGSVPIIDTQSSRRYDRYWSDTWGTQPDVASVTDWAELPHVIEDMGNLDTWAARAQAWWSQVRDDLAYTLGRREDGITFVMPTSPTVSDPDPSRTLDTVRSIVERHPTATILIYADGVRPEQARLEARYRGYLRNLAQQVTAQFRQVRLHISPEWVHQATGLRQVIDRVHTDLLCFVEHDTPLAGKIPFAKIGKVLRSGELDVVRLHPDTEIFGGHRHMMHGDVTDVSGLPVLRTSQWSQRPHVTRTGFYRDVVLPYMDAGSRTMIEDVMHSVVWQAAQHEGWGRFKLGIYHPSGSIQRSLHTDGRGDGDKFPMHYQPERNLPWSVRT